MRKYTNKVASPVNCKATYGTSGEWRVNRLSLRGRSPKQSLRLLRRPSLRSGFLAMTLLLFPILYSLTPTSAYANNISVTNAALGSQNTTTDTEVIQFDISWENSWRDSTNYDAAWVFVKYSTDSGTTWSHATLKTSGTNPADTNIGSGTGIQIIVPTDKKGAFIQRSATG